MNRLLFFAPFGSYRIHHQLDAVVASAARMRGAEVLVVMCDGLFHTCDVLAWSGNHSQSKCAECALSGKLLFEAFNLPVLQLRQALSVHDLSEIEEWYSALPDGPYESVTFDGDPIGKWITSSVYSYFRISADRFFEPRVRAIHKGFLKTGALTARALKNVFNEWKPTALCTFNGRFAPYSVAFQLAKKAGIRTLIHERGFSDNTFLTFENERSTAISPIHECAERWQKVPLSQEQLYRVKTYVANREQGKDINFTPFYDFVTEYQRVRWLLRIPPNAKVFAAFTSSEFEVAYLEEFEGITSQLEILERLVESFRGREEYLVVRHHPYVAGDKTFPADLSFLTKAHEIARNAPPNVRIIMPSEKVSSYALMWNVDACIAFFSMVGVEITSRGVAAASFPGSPFFPGVTSSLGETDKESLTSLVNTLFANTEKFSVEELRKNYRFMYSLIERLSVKFQSFGIKNTFEADLRLTSFEELAPGRDPVLDRALGYLMEGTPSYELPEIKINDAEENEFFAHELKDISRRKAEVRESTHQYWYTQHERLVAVMVEKKRGSSVEGDPQRFFPEWCSRSRHQSVELYWIDESRTPSGKMKLSQVLELITSTPAEFVLCCKEDINYDESFISSSIDALLSSSASCVRIGGWIKDAAGRLNSQFFTSATDVQRFSDITHPIKDQDSPYFPLSFFLWRKEALLQILGNATEDSLRSELERIAQSESCISLSIPLAVVGE